MTDSRINKRWVAVLGLVALFAGLVQMAAPAQANHVSRTLQLRHGPTATNETDGETSTINEQHTVTAFLEDALGSSPQPADSITGDINVDFEIISGPGDISAQGNDPGDSPQSPDFTCTVVAGEDNCSITYTSTTPGTDLIRAWIDHDKNDGTVDADLNEGRFSDAATDECPTTNTSCATATPGSQEPDITDVARVVWQSPASPLTTLDCEPETARNPATGAASTETYTCTLKRQNGQPYVVPSSNTYDVDGENLNGANDPDNTADGTPKGPQEDPSVPFSERFPEGCSNPDDDVDNMGRPCGTDRADYDHETDGTEFCSIAAGQSSCSGPVEAVDDEAGEAKICFWVTHRNEHSDVFDPEGEEGVGGDCDVEANTPGSDDADFTDVVVKTWEARSATKGGVDAEPESDTNAMGDDHTITATVYDQFGEPFQSVTRVKFEFFQGSVSDKDGNTPNTPDMTCDTRSGDPLTGGPTTNCSVTYTSAAPGHDLLCVWTNQDPTMTGDHTNGACNGGLGSEALTDQDDTAATADAPTPENDDVDVVEKNWIDPEAPSRLDCTPETASNPRSTAHEITCTVTNASSGTTGEPGRVGGVPVDVEATGANDPDGGDSKTTPDFTCTTRTEDDPTTPFFNEQGTCVIVHGPGGSGTTDSTGVTTYRGWIDADGQDGTVEADEAEGRDEAAQAGTRSEPDETDVVEKTWTLEPANLTMTPESDSASVGTCNPFTITVTDEDNNPVEGAVIDVEQRHANSSNNSTSDDPDVSFCTPSSGPNPSGVDEGRGDLTEEPDNPGTAGGETTTRTNSQGQVTIGVRSTATDGSNGTGEVTVSAFYDEDENDDPDTGEAQDTSTKTWVEGQARTIECTPNSATNDTGTEHVVTCTVEDRFGEPIQGEQVSFSSTGPGGVSPAEDTTDASGKVETTATSSSSGEQTITATLTDDTGEGEPEDVDDCDRSANDPSGAPAGSCSDSVTKTWEGGQDGRAVSLEASRDRVRYGRQFTLTATVTGSDQCTDGVTVELSRTVNGETTSEEVAQEVTNSEGVATFELAADRSASYVAQVDEDQDCGEAISGSEPVGVKKAVGLRASDSSVGRGDRVRLRVKVRPCGPPDGQGHQRERVALYKKKNGSFRRIDAARTNKKCVAVFRVRIRSKSVFQARSPSQDADHLGGRSRRKTVRIG